MPSALLLGLAATSSGMVKGSFFSGSCQPPSQSLPIQVTSSVVDPHHFDADPDSTYHPDADPDADPLIFLFDADPDPLPQIYRLNRIRILYHNSTGEKGSESFTTTLQVKQIRILYHNSIG
jgi:hypothetical protein